MRGARAELTFASNDLSSVAGALDELLAWVHAEVMGHPRGDVLLLRLAEAAGSLKKAQGAVTAAMALSLNDPPESESNG